MIREPISYKLRFQIFKRDDFTCHYCGARPPDVTLHVDHVIPVAHGGESKLDNLVTACAPCNIGKRDAMLFARDEEDARVTVHEKLMRTGFELFTSYIFGNLEEVIADALVKAKLNDRGNCPSSDWDAFFMALTTTCREERLKRDLRVGRGWGN